MKYLVFSVLFIGLLAGVYIYYFSLNKDKPDYELLEADFNITAKELYNNFLNDTDIASKMYNGKMITLSGQVNEIETVDSLIIAVFIFGEGMFGNEGIRCTFLNGDNKIKLLSDLNDFKIKGFCSGFNGSDVILEKCTVVKN